MQGMAQGLVGLMLRRPLAAGIVASVSVIGLGVALATPGLRVGGVTPGPDEEEPFTFEQAAAAHGAIDPRPVADLALTDQDGRRVRLREQAGKVVVVNFITTGCASICVQATRDLKALQQALGDRMGRDVVFLSIGLDPDTDTSAALRDFAERHAVDLRSWAFLSGTLRELEAARAAFGAVAMRSAAPEGGSAGIEHTATAYVVDRQGILRRQLPPGLLRLAGQQAIEETLAARG